MAPPWPASPEKAMRKSTEKGSPDQSTLSSEHFQFPEYPQQAPGHSYSYSSLPAATGGAAPRYEGDYMHNSSDSSDPTKNPADFHQPMRPDYHRHISDAWQQNNVRINDPQQSHLMHEKRSNLEFAQGDVPVSF